MYLISQMRPGDLFKMRYPMEVPEHMLCLRVATSSAKTGYTSGRLLVVWYLVEQGKVVEALESPSYDLERDWIVMRAPR